MSEPACDCPGPGFCPRYGVEQGPLAYGFCTGAKCSPGRSQRFRDNLAAKRDGVRKDRPARLTRPTRRRGLGDDVYDLLKWRGLSWIVRLLGYEPAGCGPCGARRRWLNRWRSVRGLFRRSGRRGRR